MPLGLTVFSRYDKDAPDGVVYVVREFDYTDGGDPPDLAVSSNKEELLDMVYDLEQAGDYDGGVVVDLTHPIE